MLQLTKFFFWQEQKINEHYNLIHIEIAKRDTIELFLEFRQYFNYRVKLADIHYSHEKN